ncbi:transcriptional regulator, partial [candidate division MSBL1 archaeon SCGC-AAA382M17]
MVTNDEENRKGLSKKESLLLSRLSSKGKKIIEIGDIEDTLDVTYKNAKKIASDLKKKGWLDRMQRGKYVIVPLEAGESGTFTEHEFLIASELVSPYYIGFLSALNFHGLTEQTPISVFVATTKRVRNRTIHNIPYYFVTLKEEKFFGTKEYSVAGKTVIISDPEKTLIDCLDHLEYSGGIEQVVNGLKEET